ncbi:hypothetical protein FGO68_gene17331 [Halteria grandinella]|uniref:Uncharacterized protein n=1 Tax=Halteria grandinella TaxID=5974 RepID=A0A8J8NNE4_HALGN|nr:hypothetical protein FGO68_gene17331 [Halteria grandinella]
MAFLCTYIVPIFAMHCYGNCFLPNVSKINWVKITCATSGLGVLFEQSKRHEIAWNLFEKRGWVKNFPHQEVVLFALGLGIIAVAHQYGEKYLRGYISKGCNYIWKDQLQAKNDVPVQKTQAETDNSQQSTQQSEEKPSHLPKGVSMASFLTQETTSDSSITRIQSKGKGY